MEYELISPNVQIESNCKPFVYLCIHLVAMKLTVVVIQVVTGEVFINVERPRRGYVSFVIIFGNTCVGE